MGKIYDAKGISTFSKEREKAYKNLEDQLQTLHKALAAVSKLDDSLQGKGADNIKKFYEYQVDNAKCWIDLVQMTKSYFSALYVKAEDANLAGNTVVDLSFLEHDLKQSVSQAKELVAQQREDLQTILHKVADLVSLSAFSAEDFNDSIDKAEKKRDETVEAVEKLDAEWLEGYRQMESNYLLTQAATNSLHGATTQGGQAYPVLFDQKAYHASELYKVQKEASEYATNYVTYHEEMKNVHELKKEAERQAVEEANKKWYEKTWDTVSTFTGEVTGYYDYKRAAEGVDPVTGRELSTSERVAAGAMAAAGFIPVVGWAGRAAKGGKAIYVTAKGVNAADHALDAYKTSKSFKALEQAEKGLYGLVAANGMYEFTTGKDMFGNAISEEQRQNSLFQSLGIAGAGALSTRYAANMGQAVVTKGTEKLTQMRNTLRTSAVANVTKQAYQSVKTAPTSWTQSLHKTYTSILDSTMPRLMPELAPVGPALAQQTVRETLQNVKQQAMQMITPIYNPKVKRYQDPETGRFVANPNVERVEKPVGVEKKGKEVEKVQVATEGTVKGKGVSETNLRNIDDFINGNKKFDEVIEDYAKVYKEHVDLNKPWSWDDTIPGGDSLSSAQKRKIKEMAIEKEHIPEIKVTKADGMRYGFADFASAGVVEKTVQLPERFWKLSDKEQFKWLDEQIGGTRKGLTWHHTEVPGKMELVPFGIHNITPHNGGRTKGMWADAPR
ncbi:T7SS effector LXG polymorphic toxin [Priestia flexa]|uniref:T7SS effector LXG polymorphic toxin n=1 Tax=Priestia flexa TaxID=86664 RepID=UPI001CFC6DC7|nr:T7SS effector LXG polymorphic toxin [Priestia flexa]